MYRSMSTVNLTISPRYPQSIFGTEGRNNIKLSEGLMYDQLEWRYMPIRSLNPAQYQATIKYLNDKYVGGCVSDLMMALNMCSDDMNQVVAIVDPGWEEGGKKMLAGWMVLGYVGDEKVQLRNKSSMNEDFDGYLMAIEKALYTRGHVTVKEARLKYFTDTKPPKVKLTLLTRPAFMDFRA